MHTGVTSARAVSKPCSSPSLSRSSSCNKLVRRRGRGSLVRSRAFIWSKDDLHKLHQLANKPRHEVTPDVVDSPACPRSPLTASSDHSSSTDADDHPQQPHAFFPGAVDQHHGPMQCPGQAEFPPDHNHHFPLLNQTEKLHHHHTATTSKPPLQRMPDCHHATTHPQHYQLQSSAHPAMPEPPPTNQSNLAVVSGITARLIDLTF